MAKRKIKEPITGVSFDPDNKLTVQKSRPLSALWNSNITLSEFKILDTYLSRINSHKPEQRSVRFEKGELEQLLGIKQIKPDVLDDRLKNLMTTVKIPSSISKTGFTRIALFEKAVAEQDENDLWQVDLTCTQSAMKYIFNIENLGYFKYKLKAITSINSRYSYILFVYLEANRIRKSWEVPLNELKEILNCSAESYSVFKEFNRSILQKCYKELNEKTPCKFKYEPIKKGRKVTSIKFVLETLQELSQVEEQILFDDLEDKIYSSDKLKFLASACNYEFDQEQMSMIFNFISTKNLPEHEHGIDFARYHFLKQKFDKLNYHHKQKKIINRFTYFLKILENSAY